MQYLFPLIMVAMLGFMMFSQRKQQKKRMEALNQIKKGDEIITIGGLYGIVDEINDQKVVLDVDGIYLTFERSAIRGRVNQVAEVETAIEETVVEETAVTEE
ncbi:MULTISPECIES: preprotein translocase subunit YajC [unclassified Streptococcus]|uniref:preprotein translocase subunit YajC n=1 Tax=unclassified Streptococcus TaxID=2608887 RepID=UPI001071695F|nr:MULTISPECIES: preprotein translocase subunit YajC [unclassified Streptococcus]MBF0787216.1 preprotein translocase subunit YajC [Streptococcus sp. 19428wC2_LYSM12]MCQ9211902.1 preprotein translocase subunit YajC [Streptococcus sp. B01]MCQ9212894.1 preprotein translocase subunit YajC [Streptococcus sp. O1]MCQ9213232.1 preprotein translocase subunit YajC [Streptococcus sp. O1]TFV05846.1 preprotein translocase subunit YajC [Streptococcus sp. LYSM12]